MSDRLRDEALRWHVCLWSGEVTAAERARFERWHQRSAAHQQAWQQVRRFGLCLEGLAGGAGAGAGAGPDAGPSVVRRPAWDDGHAVAVDRGSMALLVWLMLMTVGVVAVAWTLAWVQARRPPSR